MSGELRAAAERRRGWREWANSDDEQSQDPYADRNRNRLEDAALLADAYLAEHPADDGEPVTEEWLSASGWIDPPASWSHPVRSDVVVRFGWHGPCTGESSVILYLGLAVVAVNAARGHVRRLLAALGVPLPQ